MENVTEALKYLAKTKSFWNGAAAIVGAVGMGAAGVIPWEAAMAGAWVGLQTIFARDTERKRGR